MGYSVRYTVADFKAAKAAFKRVVGRKDSLRFFDKVFCCVREYTVDFYFMNAYELFRVTYRMAGNESPQCYEINVARMIGFAGSCKAFNVGGDWQVGGLSALNAGIVKPTNSDSINQLHKLLEDMSRTNAEDSVASLVDVKGFHRVLDVAGKLGFGTINVGRVRNAFMFDAHKEGVDLRGVAMAARR